MIHNAVHFVRQIYNKAFPPWFGHRFGAGAKTAAGGPPLTYYYAPKFGAGARASVGGGRGRRSSFSPWGNAAGTLALSREPDWAVLSAAPQWSSSFTFNELPKGGRRSKKVRKDLRSFSELRLAMGGGNQH